jgi:ABC-type multidrug transport system fused ATPase/permease subunit
MEILEYIDNISKGVLTGFLFAYLIVLGLRPAAMYPDNILEIIDNPWIFIVLLIINYYLFLWDTTIALLLLLAIVALLLDIILFTKGSGFIKDNIEIFANTQQEIKENVQYISDVQQNTFRDINNMIIDKLKYFDKLNSENAKLITEPSTFL